GVEQNGCGRNGGCIQKKYGGEIFDNFFCMRIHYPHAGSPLLFFVVQYFNHNGIEYYRKVSGGCCCGQGCGVAAEIATVRTAPVAKIAELTGPPPLPSFGEVGNSGGRYDPFFKVRT